MPQGFLLSSLLRFVHLHLVPSSIDLFAVRSIILSLPIGPDQMPSQVGIGLDRKKSQIKIFGSSMTRHANEFGYYLDFSTLGWVMSQKSWPKLNLTHWRVRSNESFFSQRPGWVAMAWSGLISSRLKSMRHASLVQIVNKVFSYLSKHVFH